MFNSVFYRHGTYLTGLAILLMIAVAIPAIAQDAPDAEKAPDAPDAEKAQVQWGSSIEEAMKQAAETGKPVMMDFYTEW